MAPLTGEWYRVMGSFCAACAMSEQGCPYTRPCCVCVGASNDSIRTHYAPAPGVRQRTVSSQNMAW